MYPNCERIALGRRRGLLGSAAQLAVLATVALWLPPTAVQARPPGNLSHSWVAGALRVDPSLPAGDSADGTYRDIELALADAPDGGALLLAPGRYPGVTLRRAVTLLAEPGPTPVSFSGRVVIEALAPDATVALVGPREGRMVLEAGLSVAASEGRCLLQGVRLQAGRAQPALFADRVAWLQLVDVEIEDAPDLRPRASLAGGGSCSADAAVISGTDGLLSRVRLFDRGQAHAPPSAPALLVRDSQISLNGAQLVRARPDAPSLRLLNASAFAAGGDLGDVAVDSNARLVWSDMQRTSRFRALNGGSVVHRRETPTLNVEVLHFPYRAIVARIQGPANAQGRLVVSSLAHPHELTGAPDQLFVADFDDKLASLRVALDEDGRATVRTSVPESLFAPGAGLVFQFVVTGQDGPGSSLPDAHLFELLYEP